MKKQASYPTQLSGPRMVKGKGIESKLAYWDCLACKGVGRSWGQPKVKAYDVKIQLASGTDVTCLFKLARAVPAGTD